MRRDLELVRKWLLYIEEHAPAHGYISVSLEDEEFDFFETDSQDAIFYNFKQGVESGLIQTPSSGAFASNGGSLPIMYITGLTPLGHDYLDAFRSETIWRKTKAGASKIGGVTLAMALDIAKAYIKAEVSEKLGVKL